MAEIDLNQVLANNLRHYMDKANLSQQALADKCGFSLPINFLTLANFCLTE